MKKIFTLFILLFVVHINASNAGSSSDWVQYQNSAEFAKKYPKVAQLIQEIKKWGKGDGSIRENVHSDIYSKASNDDDRYWAFWMLLRDFFSNNPEKATPEVELELKLLKNDPKIGSDAPQIIKIVLSQLAIDRLSPQEREDLEKKETKEKEEKEKKEEEEGAEIPYEKLSQKEKADVDAYNASRESLNKHIEQIFAQKGQDYNQIKRESIAATKKLYPYLYSLKPDPKIKKIAPAYEPYTKDNKDISHLNIILHVLDEQDPIKLGWQKDIKNKFKPNEIIIVPLYIKYRGYRQKYGLIRYKTANGYEVELADSLKIFKPEQIFKYGKDGIFALNEHDWNLANEIEQKRIKYEATPLYHLNKYIPNFEQQWEKGEQADRIAQFEKALTLAAANKDKAKVQRTYDFLELLELLLAKPDFLADKQLQYLKDDLKGKILAAQFDQALLAANKEKIMEFGEKAKAFAMNYLAQKHPDAAVKEKLQAALAQYEKYKKSKE